MFKKIHFLTFMLLYNSVYSQSKSSLTFVIDDTGSMGDDIAAVKRSANDIFDTVMNSNASQIEDFVLVTFNDPSTRHRVTTRDRDAFKEALSGIIVDGGDDCPEMSMAGVKHALEESRTSSLVYVFTDASSKDPELYDEVQRLAHKKQCQVVFVLTGTCYGEGNHLVYDQLAAYTDGQVFHLDHKGEVEKILKYVQTQISSRKAILFKKEFPAGGHSFEIPVDSKMKELVISVTGTEPSIKVTGPTGEEEDTEDIVRTRTVAIVKVKEVTPGKYTAEVSSKTKTSVVVAAETTVHFQHGFSIFMPDSIDDTTTQPVPGEKSYLSVKLATEGDGDVKLDTVQILDMDNNIVTEQRLRIVDEKSQFYVSSNPVVPPNKTFRIAIKGYDPADGREITRISLTPVEPQYRETKIPEAAPVVTLVGKNTITAAYKKPLQIKCAVSGHPTPVVTWEDGAKRKLEAELHLVELPSDYMSILTIDRVVSNGTYKCKATNKHGEDGRMIRVETIIDEYFNVVKKPRSATVEYNTEAKFECEVDANPPAEIQWFRNGLEVVESDIVEISPGRSVLTIKRMQPGNEGKYNCVVQNANERQGFRFVVRIVGVELPVIDKTTKEVRVTEGTSTNILCRILKGKPRPAILWYFKHESADSEYRIDESDDKEEINIESASEAFAGTYRCEAHSQIGYDYHNTELMVGQPPTIDEVPEHLIARDGEKTKLPCEVFGKPMPFVKWYLNDTEISLDKRYIRKERSGTIFFKPSLSDVGAYTCEAENEYGSAKNTIHLSVVIPPVLEIPKESKFEIKVGDYLGLPCRADGYPRPIIEWRYYSLDKKGLPRRLRGLSDGKLVLSKTQVHQRGHYTCIASNIGGSSNITYTVLVNAPPSIEMDDPIRPYIGVEGDAVLRVPCKAIGTPNPEITWSKNDVGVPSGTEWYDIEEDGTLVVKMLDKKSAGTYTCQAKNELGVAVKTVDIIVDAYPPIGAPSSTVSIKEGDSTNLECDLPHRKTDNIRWFKDGKLLSTEKTYPLTFIQMSDAGIYTCRVSDFVTSRSGHIQVTVGMAPKFRTPKVETDVYFEEGNYEEMDCEATGTPDPKVTWSHNGKKIPVESMIYGLTMTIKDRGEYICTVENEYGRIHRKLAVISQDCVLDVWSEIKEKQPLLLSVLDESLPNFRNSEGYITMLSGEYLRLYCPSGFSAFPDKRDVYLQCDQESNFTLDGTIYKFSNFQCKDELEPYQVVSREKCMPAGTNAVTIKMGYRFQGKFVGVYDVCLDERKRTPIYAKHHLQHSLANVEPERRWKHDVRFVSSESSAFDCKRERHHRGSHLAKWTNREDSCCFTERFLVNSKDVFPGLPQTTTFSNLNIVPHWSTCNSKNWKDVEEAVRGLVKLTGEELTVYTGIVPPYTDTPVTPYIWKVVVHPITLESVAIVQVNVPDVTERDIPRWQRCRDICNEISWLKSTSFHDVNQGYTYCCGIVEFEREFNLDGVFERGEGRVLHDVSTIPEKSLTIT